MSWISANCIKNASDQTESKLKGILNAFSGIRVFIFICFGIQFNHSGLKLIFQRFQKVLFLRIKVKFFGIWATVQLPKKKLVKFNFTKFFASFNSISSLKTTYLKQVNTNCKNGWWPLAESWEFFEFDWLFRSLRPEAPPYAPVDRAPPLAPVPP